MTTINLDEATNRLPEIISRLNPGEQLMIVDAGEPLATLTRSSRGQWPCKSGSAKETKHWMASDFDGPLDDFREYM